MGAALGAAMGRPTTASQQERESYPQISNIKLFMTAIIDHLDAKFC